jgi:hypothetical protein
MAAISLSIKNGVDGFRISDFTVGTNPPGANDIELRYNTTDANSNVITLKTVANALDAFKRAILSDAQFITPAGL